jgi:hypothetical protein
VPPPPPPPHVPPPPPHLDIVSAPDRERPSVDLFDFSQLSASDTDFEIDTAVTSGADSSSWEEVSVDGDGGGNSCDDATAHKKSADHEAPAVCSDTQSGKSTTPKS